MARIRSRKRIGRNRDLERKLVSGMSTPWGILLEIGLGCEKEAGFQREPVNLIRWEYLK
jgi:hypothetical protein